MYTALLAFSRLACYIKTLQPVLHDHGQRNSDRDQAGKAMVHHGGVSQLTLPIDKLHSRAATEGYN